MQPREGQGGRNAVSAFRRRPSQRSPSPLCGWAGARLTGGPFCEPGKEESGSSPGSQARLRRAPQAVRPHGSAPCPGTPYHHFLRKSCRFQVPCQAHGTVLTIHTLWTSVPSLSAGTPFPLSPFSSKTPGFHHRTHRPSHPPVLSSCCRGAQRGAVLRPGEEKA